MLKTNIIVDILNSGKSSDVGGLGENLVLNSLRNKGLSCYYVGHNGHSGDIRLTHSGLRIEVKTAVQSRKGEYKFCLSKNDKYGYTNYADSDIIILQCISKTRLISYYIIPAADIKTKHINLGTNSRKYAKYQTTLTHFSKGYVC